MKRTPDDWSIDYGVTILDPDGWRRDGQPWDEPITESDFFARMVQSTIRGWAYPGTQL